MTSGVDCSLTWANKSDAPIEHTVTLVFHNAVKPYGKDAEKLRDAIVVWYSTGAKFRPVSNITQLAAH